MIGVLISSWQVWTNLDPRHEHALTNHITGFDLVSICTYWITFPFRYLLYGHYHMTHIYLMMQQIVHVTRKNFRGRISQNLRAHTILITWRVSVCSIVCLIITNINNIKSYSFSCQWANCSFKGFLIYGLDGKSIQIVEKITIFCLYLIHCCLENYFWTIWQTENRKLESE